MAAEVEVIERCRICTSEELQRFCSLGHQPLANRLAAASTSAVTDPVYPLELVRCQACGTVQLSATIDPDVLFREYLYFSSFSKALIDNARAIAATTVDRYGLGGQDLVIEIGSNDGYLLKHYQAHGVQVLGIDPARNIAAEAQAHGVPTVAEFFGTELAQRLVQDGMRPSVVHANNVLAHVPDLVDVLRGVATVLAPDGVAIIETPSLREMIEQLEFDTIYHEHIYYHSLTTFSAVLEQVGLTVVDVEQIPVHGTSLRITAAHPGAHQRSAAVDELLAQERLVGLGDADTYRRFGERVSALRQELGELLVSLHQSGATVAGYGAAAKCTVLLNALGEAGCIPKWVADANPVKQGRLIPGVRRPVVEPDTIDAEQPDVLVLFVWNLADEVLAQQHEYLERGGRVLIPVPAPRIIGTEGLAA